MVAGRLVGLRFRAGAKQVSLCDDKGALKKDDALKMAACVGWIGEEGVWFEAFSKVFKDSGCSTKGEMTVVAAMALAEAAKFQLLERDLGEADTGDGMAKKKQKVAPPQKKELERKCEGCEGATKALALFYCQNCKAGGVPSFWVLGGSGPGWGPKTWRTGSSTGLSTASSDTSIDDLGQPLGGRRDPRGRTLHITLCGPHLVWPKSEPEAACPWRASSTERDPHNTPWGHAAWYGDSGRLGPALPSVTNRVVRNVVKTGFVEKDLSANPLLPVLLMTTFAAQNEEPHQI